MDEIELTARLIEGSRRRRETVVSETEKNLTAIGGGEMKEEGWVGVEGGTGGGGGEESEDSEMLLPSFNINIQLAGIQVQTISFQHHFIYHHFPCF